MTKSDKIKPGFTRVFIPARNKTIRIRTGLASNPNYMEKHGMVLMPSPVAPVVVEEPVHVVSVWNTVEPNPTSEVTTSSPEPNQVTPVVPVTTPVKTPTSVGGANKPNKTK